MQTNPSSTTRPVTSVRDGRDQHMDDHLAVEEPLEIRVGDEPLAVTMRTPGHDRELAAGFCFTEGIVKRADDLESVEVCKEADYGNVVIVRLSEEAAAARRAETKRAQRQLYMSSSCGLCGKASLDRIEQQVEPIAGRFTLARDVLMSLPDKMRAAQPTFDQTGGLHAAALFTPGGELRVLREDVGRHNAVDKVVGWALLSGQTPIDPGVLLVSGRASFEIMQKAAVAGVAFVAAVSAPSSLAVDFAARFGMTLVGFLRPGRVNVYHDEGRIGIQQSAIGNQP
jgi:FdhD protein